MDIKISNVDPSFVKEIDKKAENIGKKLGRSFSRNEYIKMLIQNDCELRLIQLKEDKFNQAVENLNTTLDNHSKALQEYVNSNNSIFHLLASGIDIEDGVELL